MVKSSALKEILSLSFLKGENVICLTTRENEQEIMRNYDVVHVDNCKSLHGLMMMDMLDPSGLTYQGTQMCVKPASLSMAYGRKLDQFHVNTVDLEKHIRQFQHAFRQFRNEDTYLLRPRKS